jgi:hypothetical protein
MQINGKEISFYCPLTVEQVEWAPDSLDGYLNFHCVSGTIPVCWVAVELMQRVVNGL